MTTQAVNTSFINLTGLSLGSSASQIGGTRNVYSNGTMTGVFYLNWTYVNSTGTVPDPNDPTQTIPDPTTHDDVQTFLTTDGNLFWGFGDKTGTYGSFTDAGWSISTTDNGFEHDIETQPTLPSLPSLPSIKPVSQSNPVSFSGVTPFYILPEKSDSKSHNIYCCLSSNTTKTTLNVGTNPPVMACQIWSYDMSHFEFNDIYNCAEYIIRQLSYVANDASGSPGHIIRAWTAFSPRYSDYDNSADRLDVPFDAGKDGQLFALLHQANTDDEDYGTMVFLLQKSENLGKTLSTLGPQENCYTTNESYSCYNESDGKYWGGNVAFLNEMPNLSWDAGTLTGVLICVYNGQRVRVQNNPGYFQFGRVDNYNQGDNKRIVYCQAQDCFGTEIKFEIGLDPNNDNARTWQIKSVNQV